MKCGLICARSARTSARASRARDGSSSASSSWVDTQRAVSRVACTSPGAGRAVEVSATSAPTTRSSAASGTTTAPRTGQSDGRRAAPRAGRRSGARSPAGRRARERHSRSAWWSPAPSQTSGRSASVIASAGEPSSVRRCRDDLPAGRPVSPARSGGAAREAVCRVSNVARSADVAKRRRDRTRPTAQTDSTTTSSSATTSHAVRTPEWSRSAQPTAMDGQHSTPRRDEAFSPADMTSDEIAAGQRHAGGVTSPTTSSAQPQDSVTPEPPCP